MEISFKVFVLFGSVILTGLSAGLFTAWSISVIPGTLKVDDNVYLAAMQSINRAILNPTFFVIFFGSIVFLSIGSIYEFHANKTTFILLLIASIAYMVGTVGITGLGNVPLNNELDVMELSGVAAEKLSEFRQYYESNWNRLHLYRTGFAILSFVLAVIALLIDNAKI